MNECLVCGCPMPSFWEDEVCDKPSCQRARDRNDQREHFEDDLVQRNGKPGRMQDGFRLASQAV